MVKKSSKVSVDENPLVSIVMPVYNGEKFIDDTIHSVLGQTYENWELIIVDDCSSDDTLKAVKQGKSNIKIMHDVKKWQRALSGFGYDYGRYEVMMVQKCDLSLLLFGKMMRGVR